MYKFIVIKYWKYCANILHTIINKKALLYFVETFLSNQKCDECTQNNMVLSNLPED